MWETCTIVTPKWLAYDTLPPEVGALHAQIQRRWVVRGNVHPSQCAQSQRRCTRGASTLHSALGCVPRCGLPRRSVSTKEPLGSRLRARCSYLGERLTHTADADSGTCCAQQFDAVCECAPVVMSASYDSDAPVRRVQLDSAVRRSCCQLKGGGEYARGNDGEALERRRMCRHKLCCSLSHFQKAARWDRASAILRVLHEMAQRRPVEVHFQQYRIRAPLMAASG
eukprot:1195851-Prorocentrum_minimum.AAC.14